MLISLCPLPQVQVHVATDPLRVLRETKVGPSNFVQLYLLSSLSSLPVLSRITIGSIRGGTRVWVMGKGLGRG